MALADLNPRSTLKFLLNEDVTAAAGKLLSLNIADSATNGVATLEIATGATSIPVGVVVVGAASDSGSYPGYATSCEIYDTLIGCFDGALAGGTVTAGDAVEADSTGRFVTASPSAGDFVIGFAMTSAASGEQFTIKFAVTKF